MKSLYDKHIELLEAMNNATTDDAHRMADARLRGFRDALDVIGVHQLSDCDLFYLDAGVDRPMCCGVWLDWMPTVDSAVSNG